MVQKKVDYPYSDVEAVVKSLSRKDYKLISPRGRYIDSPHVAYRDVAFKDDIPVGFIEGYIFSSDLKRMILVAAVHPQYRKQNVGEKLLSRCIAWASSQNLILFARIENENVGSIRMIEKAGFTMTSINDVQRVYQLESDIFKAMQVHLNTKKKQ